MTDIDAGAGAPETATGAEGPGIRILAQFIRDLSFENPRAPDSLRGGASQPQIDLGVEMNARSREDGFFEVDLKLSAKAAREDGPVFVVELLYGGVFQVTGVGPTLPLPLRAPDHRRRDLGRRLSALPTRPDRLRRRLRRAQVARSPDRPRVDDNSASPPAKPRGRG
jgi:hypothetical protein